MTAPAPGRRPPTATYRLQMHAGFTVRDAVAATPYLHALGVSHVYLSSILTAKPGSTHGYDVIDPGRMNPEIGTEPEFEAWVADLRRRGMGVILDVVPNHMSVGGDNAWWADVLENGPASAYAKFFDIAWTDHPRRQLDGKVLLPILTEPYGKAVDGGRFQPVYADGAIVVELDGRRLPTDPRTWDAVLTPAVEAAIAGSDAAGTLELQSILTAVRNLPPRTETDAEKIAGRRAECVVLKRRLTELGERHPETMGFVQGALKTLAETPAALDQFLDAQAYRPCDWRVATDEINYRRFFDVNDLAALATERPEVFEYVHAKVFDWLAKGLVDGLRIDHVDGLYDPKEYLDRLQARYRDLVPDATGPLYVVAEKILTGDEDVPGDWAVAGTTGYEFLTAVNDLFVDPAGEAELTRAYEEFTGVDEPFDDIVYRKKILILQSSLTGELHALSHLLDAIAQSERWSRDFTLNGLRHALREVVACFPVYRSYVNGGVKATDRLAIERAVRRARSRNRLVGRAVYDFIRDTLLLRDPPTGPASDEYRAVQKRFVGKFQQLTPPVMAKGCEDTTFYVYNRLLSLNEVGGDPDRFGRSPDQLHQVLARRAERFPLGLSPLATHDTKRGEDVRARLNVLSEVPAEWGRRIERWRDLNHSHKTDLDGTIAPDANDEYLLYQTLVGTRVPGSPPGAAYVTRIVEYLHKAIQEAKVHSSWINHEPEYHAAAAKFVEAILDPAQSGEFLADFDAFVAPVARSGMVNSLAQTLIRCTAPGVPDSYQGTELWDRNLVDPDNRRPIDYARRAELLARVEGANPRDLLAAWPDGRVKLFVVSRALRARRAHGDLFSTGTYTPVELSGPGAANVFAFARAQGSTAAVTVVPRLTHDVGPLSDTHLRLPQRRDWDNALTGESYPATDVIPVDRLLSPLPVALLIAG